MRLWNVASQTVLAVFSGSEAHAGEVMWAACHGFRTCLFASSGIDTAVMIWCWREQVPTIEAAGAGTDVSVQIECPVFASTAVHGGYVDCVVWHGDFLVSKSVDHCIVMWRPTMDLDLLQVWPCLLARPPF